MSGVQRYDIFGDEAEFVPQSDGSWVSYTDYATLQRENARLREALSFYSDSSMYVTSSKGFAAQYDPAPPPVMQDKGVRAFKALSTLVLALLLTGCASLSSVPSGTPGCVKGHRWSDSAYKCIPKDSTKVPR